MNKNFYLYLSGRFVSRLGDSIQEIGFPLLILKMYGTAAALGSTTIFIAISDIVVKPFVSVIADKYNKKNIMVSIDLLSGVLCLFVGFLALKDILSLPLIIIYLIIQSFISSLFLSASRAMVPEIVKENNYEKAYSLMSISDNLSSISGPALGAMLFAFFGIEYLLFINGISFIISGISELFINYEFKNKKVKLKEINFYKELKEGLTYLFKRKKLVYFSLTNVILFSFSIPITATFLPLMLQRDGGFNDSYIGFFKSISTLGTLIGATLLLFFRKHLGSFKFFVSSYLLINLSMFMIGITISMNIENKILHFIIIAPFILMIGFFVISSSVLISSNYQRSVDNKVRARIGDFNVMAIEISSIFSILMGSILLDRISSRTYIILVCTINLVLLLTYVFPGYKKYIQKD
jgi:MFS family permease